ncbi:MAG: hypothetical protein ACRCX4_09800 [Bacteroidales bacterium]
MLHFYWELLLLIKLSHPETYKAGPESMVNKCCVSVNVMLLKWK